MPMYDMDVIVVGAGPGGSAAAASLAQRGLRTLLLDKADFPRDKTCGDALTPRALRALGQLGLPHQFADAPRIRGAAVVAPSGAIGIANLPDLPGCPNYLQIVPRIILDDALRTHAVASGATFLGRMHVQQIERQGAGIQVAAEHAGRQVSFSAPVAIVATGASMGLLVRMGLLKRQPPVNLAARAYFDEVANLDPNEIQFRFDGVPLPGYAWVFPISATSANIGLGTFATRSSQARPAGTPPRALLERWIERPAVRRQLGQARQRGSMKGYPIRSDFLHAPTYAERVLLVGEAAGLVNPLTGDGIDFALESGQLAADFLTARFATGDFSAPALADYDRELRERYARLFRFGIRFRQLVMSNRPALNLILRSLPKHPSLQRRMIVGLLGQHLGQPV